MNLPAAENALRPGNISPGGLDNRNSNDKMESQNPAAVEEKNGSAAPNGPSKKSPTADDLATKTLQFLSTATPSQLAAVACALAAATYFILGQVGVLLIGVFVGVV